MDRYSTHLPLLSKISKLTQIKTCLEFGMGNYSTSFLLDNTEQSVTSIEMQSSEWFNIVKNKFGSNAKWNGILCLDPNAVFNLQYLKHYDLVLVDGYGSNRPECANFSATFSDTIVVHDTEAVSVYGWDRIKLESIGYSSFIDKAQEPWTTVYSKNSNLIKSLNES